MLYIDIFLPSTYVPLRNVTNYKQASKILRELIVYMVL